MEQCAQMGQVWGTECGPVSTQCNLCICNPRLGVSRSHISARCLSQGRPQHPTAMARPTALLNLRGGKGGSSSKGELAEEEEAGGCVEVQRQCCCWGCRACLLLKGCTANLQDAAQIPGSMGALLQQGQCRCVVGPHAQASQRNVSSSLRAGCEAGKCCDLLSLEQWLGARAGVKP